MKRLSFGKISVFVISATVLLCAAYQIFQVHRSAQTMLADERARLLEENRVPFEKKVLTPHFSQDVQIIQNTRETRDLVKFKDSYFAATGGGLAQFDENGKLIKHFSVLDGLPESDLTKLAVFQSKLFIGTQTSGLVVFDGEKFENYVWTDRKANAVTAFLETNGKLLIGTFAGGLLEYDGANFTEIKAGEQQINRVNCLFKTDAKLFVGTFDNGLWSRENDVWTQITTADKLPSNRVVGIALDDKNPIIVTDFGAAVLENEQLRPLANTPALSSVAMHGGQIFVTKDDGEIFTYQTNLKQFSDQTTLQKTRLISIEDQLFLLSDQGISRIVGAKIKPFSQPDDNAPTDNFVSAIAFDQNSNLWLGSFRRGIDVFASGGKKIVHLESDTAREINFLQTRETGISAATSGGLINYQPNFAAENTTKKDGLPSDSITHFSGDWTATAKGLAFRQNGKIRVLSTVQGLPSNSVYATLQIGSKLYAGTLGGLAEIEDNKVVRTFKDSNSELQTNWVTALIRVRERIFIGTYGGGIYELDASGEIRSFAADAGKFIVNPNAFYTDGARLYAGTLDGAKIFNLDTQKWRTLRLPLPAATVMSIAGDGEKIYFGTTDGVAVISDNYFTEEEKK